MKAQREVKLHKNTISKKRARFGSYSKDMWIEINSVPMSRYADISRLVWDESAKAPIWHVGFDSKFLKFAAPSTVSDRLCRIYEFYERPELSAKVAGPSAVLDSVTERISARGRELGRLLSAGNGALELLFFIFDAGVADISKLQGDLVEPNQSYYVVSELRHFELISIDKYELRLTPTGTALAEKMLRQLG